MQNDKDLGKNSSTLDSKENLQNNQQIFLAGFDSTWGIEAVSSIIKSSKDEWTNDVVLRVLCGLSTWFQITKKNHV